MFGLPEEITACLFDMDGARMDRGGTAGELSGHGAGLVVRDLAALLGEDAR